MINKFILFMYFIILCIHNLVGRIHNNILDPKIFLKLFQIP